MHLTTLFNVWHIYDNLQQVLILAAKKRLGKKNERNPTIYNFTTMKKVMISIKTALEHN